MCQLKVRISKSIKTRIQYAVIRTDICNNLDGAQGKYAEFKQPILKCDILYNHFATAFVK